ncbi:MAG TPA: DNA polymerase III subunit alpha [Nitrospirae bacterium]|nr:DNA polymerase III subunit alpha [Nitrospirota bacterium]
MVFKNLYIPLHLHTQYSLLDGAIKIDDLISKTLEFNLPAVAITDHGNIFGAVEFYKKAKAKAIKPIIGCEVYVAPTSRLEKTKISLDENSEEYAFHLILLVEDSKGYKNLCTLISSSYLEGFYYKPRVDKELLKKHSEGLIALSACIKGEVPYYISINQYNKAKEIAEQYREIFGTDNFFLEIQENGLDEQREVNKGLLRLSRELDIPLVATNDCHYLNKEDAKAHEILLCLQTKKSLRDTKRMRFGSDQFYFKSPEQMLEDFKELPESITNTALIAERCNFEFDCKTNYLPLYNPPDGYTSDGYLEELALKGLNKRFKGQIPNSYRDRLNREMDMIRNMGFSAYFLIVCDFIDYAKSKGIPVGPGRGSAAGSLVAYSIGITEIDPIKYGLLFERFLNPDRISMPDIDIDLCQDKRQEVINYVSEKYGHDRVAQIITFGAMKAKAAIRDVGRVLDMPYSEVDKIAKAIPAILPANVANLKGLLSVDERLKSLYNENEDVRELLENAIKLEGLSRHASKHAAGVVIAPEPITNYMPLYKNPSEDTPVTHFEMKSVENLGLLKFDFLGLATLTIIKKTLEYIKSQGKKFNLDEMPFDDKKTFDLLGAGNTTAIFQLESSGMRDILVRMNPNVFEDLIALVALYRPGPMAWIDDFIRRKKGEITFDYEFEELREILHETYGITIYQEQVMMIANKIAGFSMGQADILRKAMGKKKPEEMAKQKDTFINGAMQRGIDKERAKKLFEDLEPFAQYGFNKSHSAAYAYLAYQTAYLKAHYPIEFMSANLTLAMGETDKIVTLINDCRAMSIEILPPDINKSNREFTISGEAIRFGLEAVKGVGASAIEVIIEERQKGIFKDLKDFLRRIDSRKVNKMVTENLVKAGAFDSLFDNKSDSKNSQKTLQILCQIRTKAFELLSSNNGASSIPSLFGDIEVETANTKIWDEQTLLQNENDALGFYVSGHPMLNHRKALNNEGVRLIKEIQDFDDRFETTISGIVTDVRHKVNSKGQTTYITLEDETGSCDCLLFNGAQKKTLQIPEIANKIIVKGQVLRSEKASRMMIREISNIFDDMQSHEKKYYLDYTISSPSSLDELSKIRELLIESDSLKDCFTLRLHLPEYCVSIKSCLKPCENIEQEIQKICDNRAILSIQ